MDQIGTSVAADAINKLIVARLIQQIDDVIHLDRNRGVLRAKLESMKLLLQDIWNSFQYQQRTPPESIRQCLERALDEIGQARSLIDRSHLRQRCVNCIFCKPSISRQIREWNSRFDELRRELQTLFSIFANAQQVEKLVLMWIAEGFIKTKDMQLGYRETIEEIKGRRFLSMRVLQQGKNGIFA